MSEYAPRFANIIILETISLFFLIAFWKISSLKHKVKRLEMLMDGLDTFAIGQMIKFFEQNKYTLVKRDELLTCENRLDLRIAVIETILKERSHHEPR